jgi:hypothetical protein
MFLKTPTFWGPQIIEKERGGARGLQSRATSPRLCRSTDGVKVFVIETHPAAIVPSSVGPVPGWVPFAWLERVAFISGAQKLEGGVSALEKRFGPHLI